MINEWSNLLLVQYRVTLHLCVLKSAQIASALLPKQTVNKSWLEDKNQKYVLSLSKLDLSPSLLNIYKCSRQLAEKMSTENNFIWSYMYVAVIRCRNL